MKKTIRVKDKDFHLYLQETEIKEIICRIAYEINEDLHSETPLFLVVLNGSFMFASDLLREIDFDAEVSFIKLSSYSGIASTQNTTQLIGLHENIKNRTVVIIEDIVDTGISMENLLNQLYAYDPKAIKICTLFFKPDKFQKNFPIDYVGKSIPDAFVVGYGLDYDGYGRKYKDIYSLQS